MECWKLSTSLHEVTSQKTETLVSIFEVLTTVIMSILKMELPDFSEIVCNCVPDYTILVPPRQRSSQQPPFEAQTPQIFSRILINCQHYFKQNSIRACNGNCKPWVWVMQCGKYSSCTLPHSATFQSTIPFYDTIHLDITIKHSPFSETNKHIIFFLVGGGTPRLQPWQ